MDFLKDLEQQLKGHGIVSLSDIEQKGTTVITQHYLGKIAGGFSPTDLDYHYDFNLANDEGNTTFAKAQP